MSSGIPRSALSSSSSRTAGSRSTTATPAGRPVAAGAKKVAWSDVSAAASILCGTPWGTQIPRFPGQSHTPSGVRTVTIPEVAQISSSWWWVESVQVCSRGTSNRTVVSRNPVTAPGTPEAPDP